MNSSELKVIEGLLMKAQEAFSASFMNGLKNFHANKDSCEEEDRVADENNNKENPDSNKNSSVKNDEETNNDEKNKPSEKPVKVDSDGCDLDVKKIKKTQLARLIGVDAAYAIYRHFTYGGVRAFINKSAIPAQKNNLKELASLIISGEIGECNSCAIRDNDKSSARLIHQDLCSPFSDDFSFVPGDVKGFGRLLKSAKILYQIGENIKHIESRKQRSFEASRLYREMTAPASCAESHSDPAYFPLPVTNLRRELQAGEQVIKVCGKTYWPPEEYANPELTYKNVWGAGQLLESTYRMLVTSGYTPANAATSLMMQARAVRLIGRNGGNVYHSMAARMKDHPEWIDDPEQSCWPTHSGIPEGY